jgi:hypothetical protein
MIRPFLRSPEQRSLLGRIVHGKAGKDRATTPVTVRAGPVVARAVNTPAAAAGDVRYMFFAGNSGHHRLLFCLAVSFNPGSFVHGKRDIILGKIKG